MGDPKHDGLAIPGLVILAHELPFTMGELRVHPATRQVVRGARYETLEPRVMQVLVALASVSGAIVTRDELVNRCWDGRIVGEDAINRVLSRIRRTANDIGGGSFAVETVARVGYRLTQPSASPLPPGRLREARAKSRPAGVSRRTVVAGAATGAIAVGAAGLLWLRPWRAGPVPEARELYERAVAFNREGLPGQPRQAVAYLERAVAIDPNYAEAWGTLALSYSHLFGDEAEAASLPQRIRAASQRARELDADNVDAQLALVFITPYFRNWREKESALRRIRAEHPTHWLTTGRLATLLYQVGRLDEGIDLHRRAIAIEPMLPVAYAYLIKNLASLGRLQEAEAAIEQAHDRWPAHPSLWTTTFNYLVFNGKPGSATAFVMDPASRPTGFDAEQVETRLRLARAIETGRPDAVDASIDDFRRMASKYVDSIPVASAVFAVLGRPELAFASLERYYFDRGSFGSRAAIGPYTPRYTDDLYSGPTAALRADLRFAALLREIGLEQYWRETQTVPDYRRVA